MIYETKVNSESVLQVRENNSRSAPFIQVGIIITETSISTTGLPHIKTINTSSDQGSVGPGFINRDRDREISQFGPANEIGTGKSIS